LTMLTTQTARSAERADTQVLRETTPRNTVVNILKQPAMLIAIVAPLCLTFYAATALTRGTVSWMYPVGAVLAASLVNLGTTAGFHRMLTHQAFKAHPAVQYVLLILGAIAGMGSPVKWAHDHIHHHSHSDTEYDIHSPHTPLFQGRPLAALWQWADAHMGWMFRHQSVPVSAKAREVTNTPAARFVDRTANWWLLASLIIPLCFGWNAFVWLGAVRLFLSHHITWSVNSICHMWGKQPFQNTKDKSKNNALVGILAMGEGWHNNHHFRPTSARHGLLPGQLDLTYTLICLLERCKLVWDVQRYAQCPQCQDWRPFKAGKAVICARCQKTA
jgi:stearoyl-CoA desaturase (delta-9 desaturase)